MFQEQIGLSFERQENGSVRITKTSDGRDIRADNVVIDITIRRPLFASIVATISARDESEETWLEAMAFLEKEK